MPGAWLFLLDGFAESIPSDPLRPLALSVPRPVNTERFPAYFLLAYEPPKPAVQTLVAIVAHHEIGAIRHRYRPEIVTRIDRTVDDPRVNPLGEWFIIKHNPVHQHRFIVKLHGIARSPYHPFDEIFFFVFGKPEDDDVSSLRLAGRRARRRFGAYCQRSIAICSRLLSRGPEVYRWGSLRLPAPSSPTFKVARKASCGTSSLPTDSMRFFPSFCFSRSLRFRVI